MDIFFKCIHCGQRLVVDDAGIGMEIPCPQCAKQVVIPPESTVPPEEKVSAPPPVPILPEPPLLPAPAVTLPVRPRAEELAPPAVKAVPVVEPLLPKNLHTPIAPPRVRRPPAAPPPPRAPRPTPALAPALVEMLALVPSNLRAPAAPRRVRLPLAQPPPPRAPQPAPALPDGLLASVTPSVTPPPPAPAPAAPRKAPAFAPRPSALPPPPAAPQMVEPTLPPPPVPPPAAPAPRKAPAFAPPAEELPALPPAPVVAVAPHPPVPVPAPVPVPLLAPKPAEPVLQPPPPPPPAPRRPREAPAFAPRAAGLPAPPAAPKLPEPVPPTAPVVAATLPPPPAPAPLAPPAPALLLQGIVPPLDLGFPKADLVPASPKPATKATATAVQLNALLSKPSAPPSATPAPSQAPVTPAPVAPAPAGVRLVEISGPAKVEADQWRDLAAALARQLWSNRSPMPLRATVIEAFLHAMPRLIAIRGDASAATDSEDIRGRWGDPFAGDQPNIVGRFDRPDFEGIAARISELIERWMQHQENQARQPGSDAEEVSFTMMPVPHSAVVTFGMNYHQRGSTGRKRVACWVARVGENRFLFVGKIPPSVSVTLPGFVQSFRAEAGEPSLPMPREQILALPPPPDVDSENALTMRRLMINFCEAYFVRFDNRLAADLYDQIRRRREIARAIIPGMLQVMPPSREKRMLQQLSREL